MYLSLLNKIHAYTNEVQIVFTKRVNVGVDHQSFQIFMHEPRKVRAPVDPGWPLNFQEDY